MFPRPSSTPSWPDPLPPLPLPHAAQAGKHLIDMKTKLAKVTPMNPTRHESYDIIEVGALLNGALLVRDVSTPVDMTSGATWNADPEMKPYRARGSRGASYRSPEEVLSTHLFDKRLTYYVRQSPREYREMVDSLELREHCALGFPEPWRLPVNGDHSPLLVDGLVSHECIYTRQDI